MKKILLLLGLVSSVQAADVQVNYENFLGIPLPFRLVELVPVQDKLLNGIWLVPVEPQQQYTDTNGITTFIDVRGGWYDLTLEASRPAKYRLNVPTNVALYSASALVTNGTPPSSNTNWLTTTTGDARYYPLMSNPSNYVTASITNGLGGGGGGGITANTATNIAAGISSNQSTFFVGTIILGSGANTATITASNAQPAVNGSYWSTWTDYLDLATNLVFMTNNPVSGAANQAYVQTNDLAWGNAANARLLTNIIGSTAATNLLGQVSTNGYWATVATAGGTPQLVSLSLVFGTWVSFAAGTNTFAATWNNTNTVYGWEGHTSATNINQLLVSLTNGVGTQVYSNGAMYQITSRVGATNKNWLLMLTAP